MEVHPQAFNKLVNQVNTNQLIFHDLFLLKFMELNTLQNLKKILKKNYHLLLILLIQNLLVLHDLINPLLHFMVLNL